MDLVHHHIMMHCYWPAVVATFSFFRSARPHKNVFLKVTSWRARIFTGWAKNTAKYPSSGKFSYLSKKACPKNIFISWLDDHHLYHWLSTLYKNDVSRHYYDYNTSGRGWWCCDSFSRKCCNVAEDFSLALLESSKLIFLHHHHYWYSHDNYHQNDHHHHWS